MSVWCGYWEVHPNIQPWKQAVALHWEDAPGTSFPGSHLCGCTKLSTTPNCPPPQCNGKTGFFLPGVQRPGPWRAAAGPVHINVESSGPFALEPPQMQRLSSGWTRCCYENTVLCRTPHFWL